MIRRVVLYVLLAVVATAAAVLSFAALRDLALLCGFAGELAWLLPVAIDAGAAAGSLVWHGRDVSDVARRYAQVLTLALLTTSVAANALSHYLAAGNITPAWWVVVAVSAVAPAVLGAVIYLGVLVSDASPAQVTISSPEPLQSASTPPGDLGDDPDNAADAETWEQKRDRLLQAGVGRSKLAEELAISEWEARRLRQERQA